MVRVSPQRVIRPAARRSPAGARSLLWTGAAAALPVIVVVLVLGALTLAVLVFTATGVDSLFAVVAVEWLVLNRVPLTVDTIELGFLPLLPPLLYVAILARQTRSVLADIEQPGPREAGAAVAGATGVGLLLTVLASLLVGSAASDFAVRETSLPEALGWTLGVGLVGAGLGVWLYFRRDLREILPLWVRGGLHLGTAFVAALWAVAAALVTVGLLAALQPVGGVLEIGKDFVGMAALAGLSVAYLPNVVMAAAAPLVGGEAHLGQASYSVFAVSRGPMPEVPLAAALPTTDPHWAAQGLLLVTVLIAAGLARSVAHWFRTTVDAVKAAWLAAAVVAVVMAVTPVVAGGQLGMLGTVGTGSLIAAAMALLIFGIIGSATVALALAGLTRRRERAESELERRRRRVGTATASGMERGGEGRDESEPGTDGEPGAAVAEPPGVTAAGADEEPDDEPGPTSESDEEPALEDAGTGAEGPGDDAVDDQTVGDQTVGDDDEAVTSGTAAVHSESAAAGAAAPVDADDSVISDEESPEPDGELAEGDREAGD